MILIESGLPVVFEDLLKVDTWRSGSHECLTAELGSCCGWQSEACSKGFKHVVKASSPSWLLHVIASFKPLQCYDAGNCCIKDFDTTVASFIALSVCSLSLTHAVAKRLFTHSCSWSKGLHSLMQLLKAAYPFRKHLLATLLRLES